MSQTDDNCQGVKPQGIEKMLWRMGVLQLTFYIRVKGGNIRENYMKFIGDILRKQEKTKQGNL